MKRGISQRLKIMDLEQFAAQKKNGIIPIMSNLNLDYHKVTSMAIAGNSGSGKSYMLTHLLTMLKPLSDLTIIDPKFDSPSRWARYNNVRVIHPEKNRSKSDFLFQVNEALSESLNMISQRQRELYNQANKQFKHYTNVIDEVLALSEGVNKNIKEAFFSLLSQIALLGRATNVHLLLVSQRFDYNSIPVSVREQLNVLIQIGNINKKNNSVLVSRFRP
ncbi:DNA segregation ATPase FtsK/SpoIIIE or related protein (FtsK) [Fructobacillus cardui]|nr:DNA segregation ATPase FtsK/SpoIIIE or related protein (FtsK) [Fructobacillus cardui]